MNLDKLRKLYNSSKAQEAERAAEIQRQEANLAALKEQQERAAEAGEGWINPLRKRDQGQLLKYRAGSH